MYHIWIKYFNAPVRPHDFEDSVFFNFIKSIIERMNGLILLVGFIFFLPPYLSTVIYAVLKKVPLIDCVTVYPVHKVPVLCCVKRTLSIINNF